MAPSRNSWSLSIHLYWDFSKSWSQIQKVGVNYSKFGVNETSVSCERQINVMHRIAAHAVRKLKLKILFILLSPQRDNHLVCNTY